MAGERFVVLGLAHVRSAWFSEVARWSTAGSIPVDFVKCLTADELRDRLDGGRTFSAALVDGSLPVTDRDLIDGAQVRGCPTIVVDDRDRDWAGLGAAGVLPPTFDRVDLLDALDDHARQVGDATVLDLATEPRIDPGWRGRLVTVFGTGGSGASTLAIALAQGLAGDSGDVLLADLALHADQALLHHAGDIVPGIQELVEAHRAGRSSAEHVRTATYDVVNRRYRLLLGLRRHRDWAGLQPRAFESTLATLRHTFRTVVADIDGEVEGERANGSVEVEERNLLARATTIEADACLVVGRPGLTGTARLVRAVLELAEHGVAGDRILTVVNRAPRGQRARAELSRVIADLLAASGTASSVVGPVFIGEQRGLEQALRDSARLPSSLAAAMANATQAVVQRAAPLTPVPEPVPVAPGSLGQWDAEAATS
jgi:hypothetical protein